MSMSKREMEKFEAAQIRHDLKKFIDELSFKDLIEYRKFARDYKKIYDLFKTMRELTRDNL